MTSTGDQTSTLLLALPRQGPVLALPGQLSHHPSISSPSPAAHPLRQTSFPAKEERDAEVHVFGSNLTHSPSRSLEDVSDEEIASVVHGVGSQDGVSKQRKVTDRRASREKKEFNGSGVSTIKADSPFRKKRFANKESQPVGDENELEDEDEDEDDEEDTTTIAGRLPLYDGGQMTAEEITEERARKRMLYDGIREDHQNRSEAYYRAKLRGTDIRKLVNQTLSQSVPSNVVLAVASYTKLFAGEIIEDARRIQAQWELMGANLQSDGEIRISTEDVNHDILSNTTPDTILKKPQKLLAKQKTHSSAAECDRGPILPDHLREALRRYKQSREGGPVGFTGLSLEGRDIAASRMGGRKLFK